ncbi:hypothetical protein [Sphingobium sp.]|uniref:hypothetical protein n=1 Tax=Sphingobium sp. TaxID=1912891 RepID=UPI002C74AE3B|nr:hypothetical protein [Sphingobium sp.]HUD91285.1 hypothetical protein [Sphingobium sp.]
MPSSIPDAAYVNSFNARLAELNSAARVALTRLDGYSGMLELRDDEENFLELIPSEASPEMVAIAFRLYARGCSWGSRRGEEIAFARLRNLIGAADASSHMSYI